MRQTLDKFKSKFQKIDNLDHVKMKVSIGICKIYLSLTAASVSKLAFKPQTELSI